MRDAPIIQQFLATYELNGTYDIAASADGYTTVDTAYTGVEVQAEANLLGYDFVLRQ